VIGVWLGADVEKIVVSASSKKQCRKKAALCLLRLVRKYPEGLDDLSDDFKEKLLDLLEDPSLGALPSSPTLRTHLALTAHSLSAWDPSLVRGQRL
jgi:hypothetical protein